MRSAEHSHETFESLKHNHAITLFVIAAMYVNKQRAAFVNNKRAHIFGVETESTRVLASQAVRETRVITSS
jgi:hypothetical protein